LPTHIKLAIKDTEAASPPMLNTRIICTSIIFLSLAFAATYYAYLRFAQ
jgi:hypothetical protein